MGNDHLWLKLLEGHSHSCKIETEDFSLLVMWFPSILQLYKT